jgi:hypothetical protein
MKTIGSSAPNSVEKCDVNFWHINFKKTAELWARDCIDTYDKNFWHINFMKTAESSASDSVETSKKKVKQVLYFGRPSHSQSLYYTDHDKKDIHCLNDMY